MVLIERLSCIHIFYGSTHIRMQLSSYRSKKGLSQWLSLTLLKILILLAQKAQGNLQTASQSTDGGVCGQTLLMQHTYI